MQVCQKSNNTMGWAAISWESGEQHAYLPQLVFVGNLEWFPFHHQHVTMTITSDIVASDSHTDSPQRAVLGSQMHFPPCYSFLQTLQEGKGVACHSFPFSEGAATHARSLVKAQPGEKSGAPGIMPRRRRGCSPTMEDSRPKRPRTLHSRKKADPEAGFSSKRCIAWFHEYTGMVNNTVILCGIWVEHSICGKGAFGSHMRLEQWWDATLAIAVM